MRIHPDRDHPAPAPPKIAWLPRRQDSRGSSRDRLLSGQARKPGAGATGRDEGSGPVKCRVSHPRRAHLEGTESQVSTRFDPLCVEHSGREQAFLRSTSKANGLKHLLEMGRAE